VRLWRLFPLVRHLSDRLTPLLLRLPVTPNQVTAVSLAAGLAGAACFARGDRLTALAGAVLLIVCYILDNCDGDIARAKKLSSRFGHFFDSIADWLVDAAFFVSLGYGASVAFQGALWLWLGLATAAGATISYGLELRHDLASRRAIEAGAAAASPDAADVQGLPTNRKEAAVYIFRELFRADFCFLVLILAAMDVTWILLPAGAIGAQVYWMTSLFVGWRRFHV
jgi:phosphatidylglycerophosphate synthase